MELMAINSTNGGVHMNHGLNSTELNHGLNSTESLKTLVFIVVLGPFLFVLIRFCCSCVANVVKAVVTAEDTLLTWQVAAAEAEAVAAGLKKHESCLPPTAVYRLDRDGPGCGCTICLADFVDGEMVRILPCGHRFHVGCLHKWLVSQYSCPNCRFSLFQHVINN